MSRRWEIAIQEWYSKSPTANLKYLDLAKTEPTLKELAHNITVTYDRVSLSNRINLKNFKQIQEELEVLKSESKRLTQAVKDLTQEILENRPLTARQINSLLAKIKEQPKVVEERTATNNYKEALKATENIEAPSLGFARPADHKGPTSRATTSIKQANTQIQLLVTILERLEALDESIRKLEAKESSTSTNLPEELDPQAQLRLSMQERAAIAPAEVLYHSRQDDTYHRVYTHCSEETLLILHRQEEGTLALVVLRDNRWQGDQAIFATMEIDLTQGSQLVYVIPDTMLTISDFHRNFQISILARAYEAWQHGEANLLLTRGLVGRLSNTPNVGFAYEVQNVIDYLASSGIRALPGRRYNTRDVLGQNWVIRQSTINISMQPTEVNTRNLLDGRTSLHFENYQVESASIQTRNDYDNEDEERAHTIAVLLKDDKEDVLYVKCLTSTAVLSQRKTEGAAGYDLAVNQSYHIPPYGQAMLNTDNNIKVPKGTYERIAPRSSYAMRGMIIGGGVVDPDYRGEIKILVYNYFDDDMDFTEGETIAQLILECCKTSPIIQVHDLDKTK
ncbi:hypothetical protein ZIOFF_048274 [Zingiber officinale]|uniref:dUTP diphosphatase n=1 Tax=Zingiber officinale TaxID=94328 RepID=A0A8J5KU79_ZINOF|nr:hypothetical protein ZIOFF_048274 [Zingiber officinale]